MSNVPFTLSTATGSGNVQATYAANLYDGSIVADWVDGALCSTYPPGAAGWPPGPASDGPATNPAVVVDFLNAMLWDGTGDPSVDIGNRQLLDAAGDVVIDWSDPNGLRTDWAFPSVAFADYTDVQNSGTSATTLWAYTLAGTFGDGPAWAGGGATVTFDLTVALAGTASTKQISVDINGITNVYDTGALSVGADSLLAIRTIATTHPASLSFNIGWRCTTTASSSGITLSAANSVQFADPLQHMLSGSTLTLTVTATAGSGGVTGDITGKSTRLVLSPPPQNY